MLIVLLSSRIDDVIAMLVALLQANLITIPTMAASTVETLTSTLKGEDDEGEETLAGCTALAETLLAMADAMNAGPLHMPTTLDGLIAHKVPIPVARKLMQQVFGCTEIVVGPDTCKMVCAIDLIDWEGIEGVTLKSDIKLKSISADNVKRSLQTWLPRGHGLKFQDAMEALGDVIGGNSKGFWGKLQATIGRKFKGPDKDQVLEMVNDITRFYKVVKCGQRKKYCF